MLDVRPVILLLRSGVRGVCLMVSLISGYAVILGAAGRAPVRRVGRRVGLVSASAVASFVCYRRWDAARERRGAERGVFRDPAPFGPWTLKFYVSLIPRKVQSRIFGFVNSLTLPVFLREPIIGLFCRFYDCNLTEALEPNLRSYSNLSEFFRRPLKPELRPIASEQLVSPADGRVDRFGEVVNDRIEQVKGITYHVSSFIGDDLAPKYVECANDTKRFYCVIYLSPGDYHGFHSPVDWKVNFRRHFSGHLLGVSEKVTRRVANLFCLNERVLLAGRWVHGFFTMTAVGATHVGNIALDFERTLTTNLRGRQFLHKDDLIYASGIAKNRGDKIGEFRFGSSIVLFFEAPKDFKFHVELGQRIKFGQALGSC